MNMPLQIPEGYWENSQDSLVPESTVKAIHKLRDQTVRRIWELAEALNQEMQKFKTQAFADVATFVQISADQ